MKKEKLIAIRIDDDLAEKLEELQRVTGLNQSQLVRQLIKNAKIRPIEIQTSPMAASILEASLVT